LWQRIAVFTKVHQTRYTPYEKPVMIWDGQCGFCAYWTTRWSKLTGQKVSYEPYQEVATAFPDIPVERFKEASRLVEPSGAVFSGPRSAYRTLTYSRSFWRFLDRWYLEKGWFEKFSDRAYNWVANNRNFLFKVTKLCFGSNPHEVRPFWLIYLCTILYVIYLYF
jgi:predicted DCC family thiol-disulfide oxidoreductase YuxK